MGAWVRGGCACRDDCSLCCRLTEGEVRDVQTDETDEFWSINIKKGLVSLFQVKINGRSSISELDSDSSEWSSSSSSSFRQRNRFYELVNPLARRSRSLATDNILKVMEVRTTRFTLDPPPSPAHAMARYRVLILPSLRRCSGCAYGIHLNLSATNLQRTFSRLFSFNSLRNH